MTGRPKTLGMLAVVALLVASASCSALLGPALPTCHTDTLVADGTLTPPDSLHLPSVEITIVQVKRVCDK